MNELKCPKCGNVFKVDEADYGYIVNQVKNHEFEAEVCKRLAEINERAKTEQALANARKEQSFQTKLAEIEKRLNEKDAEIQRLKGEKENALSLQKAEMNTAIANLKQTMEGMETQKRNEMAIALAQKEETINKLKHEISQNDNKLKLALMEQRINAEKEAQEKEHQIVKLQSEIEQEKSRAQLNQADLKKQFDNELRLKQEQIDYYRDLKTKMSTKMVGETLEQHCNIEYERYLRPMLPNAFFGKDNDASDGTKGDFLFRDS